MPLLSRDIAPEQPILTVDIVNVAPETNLDEGVEANPSQNRNLKTNLSQKTHRRLHRRRRHRLRQRRNLNQHHLLPKRSQKPFLFQRLNPNL